MTNNDVLRRLRYTFNLRDAKVVNIFALAGRQVTAEQVQFWLLKEDEPQMVPMSDVELASFLNGFIIEKRGRKDGDAPVAETELTKNLILLKLKIALKLQNEDIIALLATTGFTIGKSELSAFFRKADHKNYRHCKSQFLRNFLQALQDKYRQAKPVKKYNAENKANESKTTSVKQHYVNPKLAADTKPESRKVLKLKPQDIYKDH